MFVFTGRGTLLVENNVTSGINITHVLSDQIQISDDGSYYCTAVHNSSVSLNSSVVDLTVQSKHFFKISKFPFNFTESLYRILKDCEAIFFKHNSFTCIVLCCVL